MRSLLFLFLLNFSLWSMFSGAKLQKIVVVQVDDAIMRYELVYRRNRESFVAGCTLMGPLKGGFPEFSELFEFDETYFAPQKNRTFFSATSVASSVEATFDGAGDDYERV